MMASDFQAFRAALERTAAAYGKALPADVTGTYFDDLLTYPLAAVLGALDKARQSGKFFPRVSTLRELCTSDASVSIQTDVPMWVNHDEERYWCSVCADTGFTRGLTCAGDGACKLGHCGREGHNQEPHAFTRRCTCRAHNPVLRRQREIVAARTARTETV